VRLALTELEDSLQSTLFRDYPLDLEVLDFFLKDVSFDWRGLMRDVVTPTLPIAPYLSSGPIARRCEEMLRIYQDVSSLVYQCELEIHEIHRHLEAARLRYCSLVYQCGPARLLVQEVEDRR
jgi:hypothetical protein